MAYNFTAVTVVVAVAIFSKNALFDEFLWNWTLWILMHLVLFLEAFCTFIDMFLCIFCALLHAILWCIVNWVPVLLNISYFCPVSMCSYTHYVSMCVVWLSGVVCGERAQISAWDAASSSQRRTCWPQITSATRRLQTGQLRPHQDVSTPLYCDVE